MRGAPYQECLRTSRLYTVRAGYTVSKKPMNRKCGGQPAEPAPPLQPVLFGLQPGTPLSHEVDLVFCWSSPTLGLDRA